MPSPSHPSPKGSTTPVSVLRATSDGLTAHDDLLATEEPLEIQVSYEKSTAVRVARSISLTMRTPGHDAELAAGFLFGEGLLHGPGDVQDITPADDGPGQRIRINLRAGTSPDLRSLERHFYTTSSCGVCGKTSIEALRLKVRHPLDPQAPVVDFERLLGMPETLRKAQGLFDRTGGLHAAGLFDANGELLACREDVGRHNAVDKVIGSRFLAGHIPLSRCVLMVSGRASFELMQKALMAGIPVLAAVGAPSSLAVAIARTCGATLLGFVRDGRLNVYAGAHRLCGVPEAALKA